SLVLLVGVTVETIDVRPELFGAIAHRPIAWIGVGAVVAGALAIVTGLTGRREARAFAGSCAAVAGLLAALAPGVFPVMLHSTLHPARSLTAYAGASAAHSLAVALVWWPIAAVLAFIYLAIVARTYRGKVRPAEDTQGFY